MNNTTEILERLDNPTSVEAFVNHSKEGEWPQEYRDRTFAESAEVIRNLKDYIKRLYLAEVEEIIEPEIWDDCPFQLDETTTHNSGVTHE